MQIKLMVISAAACITATAIGMNSRAADQGEIVVSDAAANDQGWPRVISSEGTTIRVYQPQVDTWKGNRLSAYSAVSVETSRTTQMTYGVIYFTARTEVDKTNRLVTLDEFKFTRANFPTDKSEAPRYLSILQMYAKGRIRTISLDRLEAALASARGMNSVPGRELENSPPRIIFTTRPAMLVLIDGEPVMRPTGESGFERVLNTRALLINEERTGTYYLSIMGGWMKSPSLYDPWSVTKGQPAACDRIRTRIASTGDVDLMEGDKDDTDPLEDGIVPLIYVSTVPAELLQVDGEPKFTPIDGTSLLYVSNSGEDIFMDTSSQEFYTVISGRWFKSVSLSDSWSYVSAKHLPDDFGRIPAGSPKAGVLVSVPGTPQAQEAVIANEIPQTAVVTRSEAKLNVVYDGAPQFAAITGTPMRYAINSATPVIYLEPTDEQRDTYFAVDNGVWFTSTSPMGPWTAAASVPDVVYTIPPSCPIYNVTYVRIYKATPTLIYCGYTPGYYGTVVSNEGVVVYGTGWRYPCWLGSVWIGNPWTYGWGVSFTWSSWGGWSFDFGVGYGYPIFSPWYGPLRYHWHDWWRSHHPWPRQNWWKRDRQRQPRGWGGFARVNVYERLGPLAKSHTNAIWARPNSEIRNAYRARRQPSNVSPGRPNPTRPNIKPNVRNPEEIFANKQGEVFRRQPDGNWQQRNNRDWKREDRPGLKRQLDQQRQNRINGQQRDQNFRRQPIVRPNPVPVPRPTPAPRPSGGTPPKPSPGGSHTKKG